MAVDVNVKWLYLLLKALAGRSGHVRNKFKYKTSSPFGRTQTGVLSKFSHKNRPGDPPPPAPSDATGKGKRKKKGKLRGFLQVFLSIVGTYV